MKVDVIEHNHHRITIEHDAGSSDNPLTMDFTNGISGLINRDRSIEEVNGGVDVPTLTRDVIKKNAKAICEMTGHDSLLAMYRDDLYGYGHDVVEVVNNAMSRHIMEASDTDTLNDTARLYEMLGMPVFHSSGQGYSQSDWHEILLVMDPKVQGEFEDPTKALESLADEYEKWVYGDVYGYRVEAGTLCECCGHTRWDEVDSCYGFIARRDDTAWTSMIEQAKEACV